ncbi:double-strand break repair helicase AddA [Sphingomicrobium sp. XHP0239]|uniref:double-strand break repair helicase AddA n=1 Tax=Sphingomicrobium maritimum TaxID=3133972 RepID=UPI0031CC8357
MGAIKDLPHLQGAQAQASDPRIHAALSASAGTGKTTVLTARVLRLLLQGVSPSSILCLTFTRAAAAEMANRINQRLAHWVRLDERKLRAELVALGEPKIPSRMDETLALARQLFARLLDTPGGLRIETIHAFSQGLLAAFPAEAGIPARFEAIDDTVADALAGDTLAALADDAAKGARGVEPRFLADLETMSIRMGQQGAEAYLKRCAAYPQAFEALADRDIDAFLRAEADLPSGDAQTIQAQRLQSLDRDLFERLVAANRAWGTGVKATTIVDNLTRFLAAPPDERPALLPDLATNILKKADGEPCKPVAKQEAAEPDYLALAERFAEWYLPIASLPARIAYLDDLAACLRAGRAFVAGYAAAKRARGYADFTDLIVWTLRLLERPGVGDWIRYKLDARIDHVLVDEAQDTNEAQWTIIRQLVDEFFAGNAETDGRFRTLFMVGDFKQAIYGFQGSQPRRFIAARDAFRDRAQQARLDERAARPFADLSVAQSFRSAPAILHAVDQAIHVITPEAMGLNEPPPLHEATREIAGRVELWPPFALDEEEAAGEEGEEDWLDIRDRQFAEELATRLRAMIADEGIDPGDILILLRRRSELASLIVARLFAKGVPVAGVDRLFLSRPLAVQDLLAAMRFATQPLDDLSLASLLVGPFFGWSQERLQHLAIDRPDSLWRALRDDPSDEAIQASDTLAGLLAMADYVTPAVFLETILSGPMNGRRKLMARLGEDARDPIEELLNSALALERRETVSLDRFLHRIENEDNEIKRETEAAGDKVRVMTVHGAKGLEAPVVVLADATWDPDGGPGQGSVTLPLGQIGELPLPRPRKDERGPPFDAALEELEAREREEHWRLLYVAMTRAEQRLIVTGTMPRPRGNRTARIADDSWHARLRTTLEEMDCQPLDLPWGEGGLCYATDGEPHSPTKTGRENPPVERPEWLDRPAPREAHPPRPLRPSAIEGEDTDTFPPAGPAQRDAMVRGTRIHALLERLPPLPAEERRSRADHWLEAAMGVAEAAERTALIDSALGIIEDPRFDFLFGPGSLAEAPLSAVLPNGRVIAGTVDRLVMEDDRIAFVDYKTGRHVPAGSDEIPSSVRAQIAAYRDALAVIFPDRPVEAHLLYTAGPALITLP